MTKIIKLILAILCILLVNPSISHTAETDLNTILMRSTFKIAGKDTLGTVFIIGKPVPGDTQKLYYVLVTAAHVLKDIKEDVAILYLRKKLGDEFIKIPIPLTIRKQGQPIWKEHPNADVAVMYIRLPQDADLQLLPMSLLATDKELNKFEIHPGDNLSCLGYPCGAEANDAGFPILRSGQIASYPLTPTSKVKTFLYDFRVFGGNSGGPVYFIDKNRAYGGSVYLGNTVQFFAGLVSQEKLVEEEIRSLTEIRRAKHPLSLAIVIHAELIKETIDLLPTKPEE